MTVETAPADTLWEANFPAFFHWAAWPDEDESVFFHQGSGETLLLGPLGAFLLDQIAAGPTSAKTLAQSAARRFDLPVDDELTNVIDTSLRTFADKGLVFPAPS